MHGIETFSIKLHMKHDKIFNKSNISSNLEMVTGEENPSRGISCYMKEIKEKKKKKEASDCRGDANACGSLP